MIENEVNKYDDESADDNNDDDDDDKPPLHVFFDIEAKQMHEQHKANLLVVETEEDDESLAFEGEHCLEQFIMWLDDGIF